MSNSKFLQIHTLTPYPASLLNRDDAGFAKRIPFGGASRTRISSQCLKYHWRNFDGENSLNQLDSAEESYRSRETFKRKLAKKLIDEGHSAPLARAGTYVAKEILVSGKPPGKNDVKKVMDAEEGKEWEELDTGQITIFGAPEVRYLKELIEEKVNEVKGEDSESAAEGLLNSFKDADLKKNLKGMKIASGLNAALFGRMVTSDILSRGDAAVHVAHAFTTHEEESESDYFSAVDELRRDEPEESGELGAGHIGSTELASGLFYNYVVVDVPLLVSNIEAVEREAWKDADSSTAAEVVQRLVQLVSTVSPGAKLGSTAPYSYAQCLLVESGSAQPRTLANAFHKPVAKNGKGILANSFQAMAEHMADLDGMYGRSTERTLAAMGPKEELLEGIDVDGTRTVPEVADWAFEQIKNG